MIFGVDYYPEHWDRSEWEKQAELMVEGGYNHPAAPPKWLVNKYDVLQRDRYKRERSWGSRRECCANSVDYIGKSRIVVEKMAEHKHCGFGRECLVSLRVMVLILLWKGIQNNETYKAWN